MRLRPLSSFSDDTFEKARKVYLEAMRNGEPKHKLARITAEALGLYPERVRKWAQKFGSVFNENRRNRSF